MLDQDGLLDLKGWDRLEQLAADLAGHAHITVLLGHSPALSPIHLDGAPGRR